MNHKLKYIKIEKKKVTIVRNILEFGKAMMNRKKNDIIIFDEYYQFKSYQFKRKSDP